MRLLLTITLFLAAAPSPLLAQASDGMMLSRMRAADTNRDGVITKPEMLSFRAANFSRIDRNGNGFLAEDDIPALLRGRSGLIDIAAMKTQFDANRDGQVSRDEFVNGPTLVFDRADSDRNGQLISAEIDAAVARGKTMMRR